MIHVGLYKAVHEHNGTDCIVIKARKIKMDCQEVAFLPI